MPHRIRTGGFTALPHALLDSAPDPFVITVYAALHRHGATTPDGCQIPLPFVASTTAVQHATRRSIAWLIEHQWIEREERIGYPTIYRLAGVGHDA
jgi:hypothetical protein